MVRRLTTLCAASALLHCAVSALASPFDYRSACQTWIDNQARFQRDCVGRTGELVGQVLCISKGDGCYWIRVAPVPSASGSDQVAIELRNSVYEVRLPSSARTGIERLNVGDIVSMDATLRELTRPFEDRIEIGGYVGEYGGSVGGGTVRVFWFDWTFSAASVRCTKTRERLAREAADREARQARMDAEAAARLEILSRPQRLCDQFVKAASEGDLEGIRLAIERGADVNGVSGGQTALMAACAGGRYRAVRVLLRSPSIEVNRKTDDGRCALLVAMQVASNDILKLLEDAGAKLD